MLFYSVTRLAFNCNVKKQSAELAQIQTIEVLYAYAIGFAGSCKAKAIVIWLADDRMEVLLCDTALKFKIFFKEVEGIISIDTDYTVDNNISSVTLIWNNDLSCEQVITYILHNKHYVIQISVIINIINNLFQIIHLFSFVTIKVEKIDKELRVKATLLSPLEG